MQLRYPKETPEISNKKLGVKLFFDKDAEFEMHSCAAEDKSNSTGELDCASCQIKEVADCQESK